MDVVKRFPLREHDINSVLSGKDTSSMKPGVKVVKNDVDKIHNDVPYFRDLLHQEREHLMLLCDEWKKYDPDVSVLENCDAIMGDIRTVVGQAHLIMAERFTQFEGLVDSCEHGTSAKPVTCQDLQGFWDMIYFQVEDVSKKFCDLDKRKQDDWKSVSVSTVADQKKIFKKRKPKAAKTNASAEARRAEARKRLAAAKAALKKEPTVTFDAVFFKVESPVRPMVQLVKTPCSASKDRKRPATPSSGNFLHGRLLRKQIEARSPDLKKYLSFNCAGDEMTENKKATADKSCKDLTNTAEDISPILAKSCKAEMQAITTQTDVLDEKILQDAFQRLFTEVEVIRDAQKNIQENSCGNLRDRVNLLEKENELLTSRIEEMKANFRNEAHPTLYDDESYASHYKRTLGKVKCLETELKSYRKLKEAFGKGETKLKNVYEFMETRTKSLEQFYLKLQERDAVVKEKENKENMELNVLRKTYEEQCEEMETLRRKAEKVDSLSEKVTELVESEEKLTEERNQLKEEYRLADEDRNKLKHELSETSKELEVFEKNLNSIREEKSFEREEYSNEKSYWEEEKDLLHAQLNKTEEMLEDAKNVLEKAHTKSKEHQMKINKLTEELDTAKVEMQTLRNEADITKTNSRLAILEQQQEVVSSELRLKEISESMNKFLTRLKAIKTGKEPEAEADYLTLVQQATKTPAKSLVVSALIREAGPAESPDWSPDIRSDGKAEACLFALINGMVLTMNSITETALEVSLHHEGQLRQLISDKSGLLKKIEYLKRELARQGEYGKEVEISLRRRVNEVTSERDMYLERLRKSSTRSGEVVQQYRC